MIKDIKSVSDFTTAIGNKETGIIVIDFSALWCGPCNKITPFILTLTTKYPEVNFYKVDIDCPETKDIVIACQISQIPTFCFFYGGVYIKSLIGTDETKLDNCIENLLDQYKSK